ncbi:zinc-ribbon domain containing protein, partial [Chloroflexota bacterium]
MNVVFTEKKLTCADCGQEFIFTEGEQRYFWSKGLAEPKR